MTGTGAPIIPSVDSRTVCGIKDCNDRATSLFAWPKRQPVPLCATCRAKILDVVEQMVDGIIEEWSPDRWLAWIKEYGKDHLFSARRRESKL